MFRNALHLMDPLVELWSLAPWFSQMPWFPSGQLFGMATRNRRNFTSSVIP